MQKTDDELLSAVALKACRNKISGSEQCSKVCLACIRQARAIIPLVLEHERERCVNIANQAAAEASNLPDYPASLCADNIAAAIRGAA